MEDFASTQYIISQVFVTIAYGLLAMTYFVTKRWQQLAITITSNVSMGIGFVLLGAWVAVPMCIIAICRDITSSIINSKRPASAQMKNTKLDWGLLVLWLTMMTVATIFTQTGFMTLFAYFATITFTISIWQKNPLIYRALGVLVGVFWIIYNVVVTSVMGITLESVLLVFVIIGLIKYCINSKDKKEVKSE
jgi:hypothetical protein